MSPLLLLSSPPDLLSSPTDRGPVKSVRRWILYGAFGFALALGAPVGCLLLRRMTGEAAGFGADFQAHRFFYLYLAVGTLIVFTSFGIFLGASH